MYQDNPIRARGSRPFLSEKGHALARLIFSGFPMSAMSRDYGDGGDSLPPPRACGPRATQRSAKIRHPRAASETLRAAVS
jgi:hypothetical protein